MKTGWLFWVLAVLAVGAFVLVLGSALRFSHESMRLQNEVDELQIQALARDLAVPVEALYVDYGLTQVVDEARAHTYWRHGSTAFIQHRDLLNFTTPGQSWPREEKFGDSQTLSTWIRNTTSEAGSVDWAIFRLDRLTNRIKHRTGVGEYLAAHQAVYANRIRPLLVRLLTAYPQRNDQLRIQAARIMVMLSDRESDLSDVLESMAREEYEFHRGEVHDTLAVTTMLREAGWPTLADKIEADLASQAAVEVKAEADRQSAAVFAGQPPVLDGSGRPLPPGAVMRLGPLPVALDRGIPAKSGDAAVGHTGIIFSLAISADGRRIVSGGGDGLIVWDGGTGRLLRRIKTNSPLVILSADGRLVYNPINSSGGKSTVFDVETGQPVTAGPAGLMAISPDSRYGVFRAAPSTVELRDLGAQQSVRFLSSEHPVEAVAFSSDGRRLLAADQRGFSIFDVASGGRSYVPAAVFSEAQVIYQACFSADGRLAATRCGDVLRFWRLRADGTTPDWRDTDAELILRDGTRVRWTALPEGSYRMAMSPDGRLVAVGAKDGSVSVFSTARQEEGLRLVGHQDHVYAMAFTSDSKRLVTGGADRAIFVWDVGPAWEKAGPPIPPPAAK